MKITLLCILVVTCFATGCSRERSENSSSSPMVRQKGKRLRSYYFPETSRQWVRTIGKNRPARIDNLPQEKIFAADDLIGRIATNLLEICTNRTEEEIHEIVRQLSDVTDGLGYVLCGEYFKKLQYACRCFNLLNAVEALESPPTNFSRSISNCCYLVGSVADMSWTKAGMAGHAQDIDYQQLLRFKHLSKLCNTKNWKRLQTMVERLKQEWIEKRFDAPDCHLRIFCDEIGEDAELDKTGLERPWSIRGRYDNPRIYFAVKAVGRYPKWLKGVVLDDEGRVYDPSKK